jgi:tripartite-type tricarboxylate transporter receptor subunit TctC
MKISRCLCAVFLSVSLVGISAVMAAEFPSKPITLVVNFAPGTSTDVISRLLAEEVAKELMQPVVCVNKAGGGGASGVAEMLRADPDGYTVGCINMPALAILPQMQSVPYQPLKDVTHICAIMAYEYAIYVRADSPYKTFEDLIKAAKTNPGKVTVGHPGVGTTSHIIMERIGKENGIAFKHVPYKGDGELMPAIMGGHVETGVGSPAAVGPQVKAGTLRLLLVTSKERWSGFPEVPTILEKGYKFYQSSFLSIGAPSGVAEATRMKIESAFKKVLTDPKIMAEAESKLSTRLGYISGKDYSKYIKDEYDFYAGFLKEQGLIK